MSKALSSNLTLTASLYLSLSLSKQRIHSHQSPYSIYKPKLLIRDINRPAWYNIHHRKQTIHPARQLGTSLIDSHFRHSAPTSTCPLLPRCSSVSAKDRTARTRSCRTTGPVLVREPSPLRDRVTGARAIAAQSGSRPGDMKWRYTMPSGVLLARRFTIGLRVSCWCACRPRGPGMCMRSAVLVCFERLLTQMGGRCIRQRCYTVFVDCEAYSELSI